MVPGSLETKTHGDGAGALKVFYSYSHRDETHREQLSKHLAPLRASGRIRDWHFRKIIPGQDWFEEELYQLDQADLVLFLVSPDFLESQACQDIEVPRALERKNEGLVEVVPILVRPSSWEDSALARLQILPTNKKPVTLWENADLAWVDVARGVKKVCDSIQVTGPKNVETYLDRRTLGSPSTTAPRIDWGEAPDLRSFHGRAEELRRLRRWIVNEHCRLVAIVGLRGIGKTRLSIRLGKGGVGKTELTRNVANGITEHFDFLIWKRLLNAPPPRKLLCEIASQVSGGDFREDEESPNSRIVAEIIGWFKKHRCLVIFDNFESVLQEAGMQGYYKTDYEDYGKFLRQVAEVDHGSCVLLTSREKPQEIVSLETADGPVRCLPLRGLDSRDAQQIFSHHGDFVASSRDWSKLTKFYDGNPLALELAAKHIKEVFASNVGLFLSEGKPVFNDLRDLLDWHFQRLSPRQVELLFWLAINREAVSLGELKSDLASPESQEQLTSTLQQIQRRIPLEKSTARYTLQPVLIEYLTDRIVAEAWGNIITLGSTLLEYVTDRIVDKVSVELRTGKPDTLESHALVKAVSKDYVRNAQFRLLLDPIRHRLKQRLGGRERAIAVLTDLLRTIRSVPERLHGYTAGNIINLLCRMKWDLTGADFSNLVIRQAYLQEVELRQVDFSNCEIYNSVFTKCFGMVLALDFAPNSTEFAAGDSCGSIYLLSATDSRQLQVLEGHSNWVRSVAFSPDGKRLASCGDDCTIRVWDLEGKEEATILGNRHEWLWCVRFSPDGQLLGSCGDDGEVSLWEAATGRKRGEFNKHRGRVLTLDFAPDCSLLASGGDDGEVVLWDISTGRISATLRGHEGRVRCVRFNGSGNLLATSSDDRSIRLWEVPSGRCIKRINGHGSWIRSVAFLASGKRLVSSSDDGDVRIWDVVTGECIRVLRGHSDRVRSLALHRQRRIIASGSDDQSIVVWDQDSGRVLKTFRGYTNSARSAAYSPDGKWIVSGHKDRLVRLWKVDSRVCKAEMKGHGGMVLTTAFSRDGKILASGSDDKTIRLWDRETGQCIDVLKGHTDWIWSVAFSPVGDLLVSGGEDSTLKVWDLLNRSCIATLKGHRDWIRSLVFSPDGKYVVTASNDSTLILWDIESFTMVRALKGHTKRVWSVDCSPDSRHIASGSDDQTVRIWRLDSGECDLSIRLPAGTGGVSALRYNSSGRLLAVAGYDRRIRIWDTNQGKFVETLVGHNDRIRSLAFSPTGEELASASEDQTITLWRMKPGRRIDTLRPPRPYEGMTIFQVRGLSAAERHLLKMLGASEDPVERPAGIRD